MRNRSPTNSASTTTFRWAVSGICSHSRSVRADGGNATAANHLLGSIRWLANVPPGIYDGLDAPLHAPLPGPLAKQRWES